MGTDDYDEELRRRLAALEDPEYDDPARTDLPRLDLVLLAVGGVIVVAVMWFWGYPA